MLSRKWIKGHTGKQKQTNKQAEHTTVCLTLYGDEYKAYQRDHSVSCINAHHYVTHLKPR